MHYFIQHINVLCCVWDSVNIRYLLLMKVTRTVFIEGLFEENSNCSSNLRLAMASRRTAGSANDVFPFFGLLRRCQVTC